MRKVVDELVVTLNLDVSGFKTGMAQVKADLQMTGKSAVDAQINVKKFLAAFDTPNVSRFLKSYQQSLTEAGREQIRLGQTGQVAGEKIDKGMRRGGFGALSLLYIAVRLNKALGFPALYRMSEEVVSSETKTLRLANALKLNTTYLQEWQLVMGRHGVDAEAFNGSLERIAGNIGKLGTNVRGAKIMTAYLGLAGISDSMVKGKDSLAFLKLYIEQMGHMTSERQFTVGRRLGLTNEEIEAIKEAGPALSQQLAAMKGLAATQEELLNAREVSIAQKELSQSWERAKQQIVSALLPSIKSLIGALTQVTQWVRNNKDIVVMALLAIATACALVAVAAVQMAAGFVMAQVAAGGLLSIGLLPVVAAVVAAAGGFVLLNQYLESSKDRMDAVSASADAMTQAMEAGHQDKDKKFGARRAAELSRVNMNTGMMHIGETIRHYEKERHAASLRAGATQFLATALNAGPLGANNSGAKRVQEIDSKLADLTYKKHQLQANMDKFDRAMQRKLGPEGMHALKVEGGHLYGKAVEASIHVNTVTIQVGTAKEGIEALTNLRNHTALGGGGMPPAPAYAGGMDGN